MRRFSRTFDPFGALQLDICRRHVGNNLSLYVLNQNQHNVKEGL